MDAYFKKHPYELHEVHAIKAIRKKLKCAIKKHEKEEEVFFKELNEAREMLDDLIAVLDSPTPARRG